MYREDSDRIIMRAIYAPTLHPMIKMTVDVAIQSMEEMLQDLLQHEKAGSAQQWLTLSKLEVQKAKESNSAKKNGEGRAF